MALDQARLRIATSLARFASEGVQRVEWVAAVDGTACPRCDANDGRAFTIADALRTLETDFCEHGGSPERGCRCIVAPAVDPHRVETPSPLSTPSLAPERAAPALRPFSQRISRRPCPFCWQGVKAESPRCTNCHKRIAGLVALVCPDCRRKWSAPEECDIALCPKCGCQVNVTEAALAAVDRMNRSPVPAGGRSSGTTRLLRKGLRRP